MIATAHLFRPLGRELIALLQGLRDDRWSLQTSAPEWRVRDVAAHLLDVDLRRLSARRDAHGTPGPGAYDDLVAFLDAINAEWVRAARRLSARVLTDLLAVSTDQVADVMEADDPGGVAVFPVAWAGQSSSPMWLDIGREYTERWHHQDQIRDAAGAPPLEAPHWLRPVIEVSLFALPHAYAAVAAPDRTRIALAIRGPAGGEWTLERVGQWQIRSAVSARSACRVEMRDLDFARLLLHRLTYEDAQRRMHVSGASSLAEPLLRTRAVMVRS